MDIDVDTDTEEGIDHGSDEHFIPGCHVLDVEPFPEGEIWIRAEYIRIFDYIFPYFENDRSLNYRKPQVIVLTGQSGIGKCHRQVMILMLD